MKVKKISATKFVISGLLAASLGLTGIAGSVDKAFALDCDSKISEDGHPPARPLCNSFGYPVTPSFIANIDAPDSSDNSTMNGFFANKKNEDKKDSLLEKKEEEIPKSFIERKKMLGHIYYLYNNYDMAGDFNDTKLEKIWVIKNSSEILCALDTEMDMMDDYLDLIDLPWYERNWIKNQEIPISCYDYKTITDKKNLSDYYGLLCDESRWIELFVEGWKDDIEQYMQNVKDDAIKAEYSQEMDRMHEMYDDSHFDTWMLELKNLTDQEAELKKDVDFFGNELFNLRYLFAFLRSFVKEDEIINIDFVDKECKLPVFQRDLSCHELVVYINEKKMDCQQKLNDCKALMSKTDSNCTIDLSSKDLYLQEKTSSFSDSDERKNLIDGVKAEYLSNIEVMNSRKMIKDTIEKAEALLQERIEIYNSFLQSGEIKNDEALYKEGTNILSSLQESIYKFANETNSYYAEIDKLPERLNKKMSELNETRSKIKNIKEGYSFYTGNRDVIF